MMVMGQGTEYELWRISILFTNTKECNKANLGTNSRTGLPA